MTHELLSIRTSGAGKVGAGAFGKRIDLHQLAVSQRLLLRCMVIRVAFDFLCLSSLTVLQGNYAVGGLLAAYAIIHLLVMAAIYRMMRAHGHHPLMALIPTLAFLIPVFGIVALSPFNARIVRTLRSADVPVGFLGVTKTDLARLREGVCPTCGYDLSGLSTARCPECGASLPAAPAI